MSIDLIEMTIAFQQFGLKGHSCWWGCRPAACQLKLRSQQAEASTDLVEVESAFQQLRPQGVLLLVGMQKAPGVQKPLGQGAKHLPEAEVVPVGLLCTQHISRQHLHACKVQSVAISKT